MYCNLFVCHGVWSALWLIKIFVIRVALPGSRASVSKASRSLDTTDPGRTHPRRVGKRVHKSNDNKNFGSSLGFSLIPKKCWVQLVTRPWSIQMGSRPFLSLADVAGHTQFRPDRACGASAPTQSMKLSEVKRKSNQRKKERSNGWNNLVIGP